MPLADTEIMRIRIASAENTSHAELSDRYACTERHINSVVAGAVAQHLPLVRGREGRKAALARLSALTPRILDLYRQGETYKRICELTDVSVTSLHRIVAKARAAGEIVGRRSRRQGTQINNAEDRESGITGKATA